MSLLRRLAAAFRPENPASTAYDQHEKRLCALEDAVGTMQDENDHVLEMIRRFTARQAAQKRHEAVKNLKLIEDSDQAEIIDPGANGDDSAAAVDANAEREKLKARVRAKMAARGIA